MNFLDLFGSSVATPVPQKPKTRETISPVFSLFSSNRRSAELEIICHDLNAKCASLKNSSEVLTQRLVVVRTERDCVQHTCDRLAAENRLLKIKNQELENSIAEMKQDAANLKESHANQEARPDWAKHLDVNDLFADSTNAEDKACRFRALSKIYHTDIRNNPAGLKRLLDHLQASDPSWFRAACHEAYLLIARYKGSV